MKAWEKFMKKFKTKYRRIDEKLGKGYIDNLWKEKKTLTKKLLLFTTDQKKRVYN